MPCYLQLTLCGKQQGVDLFLGAQCRNELAKHNEQVKKNLVTLRRFTDAVCPIANHSRSGTKMNVHIFNPSNAKLNPICHLLALLGAYPILHVSRIRVKLGAFRGVSQCAEKSRPKSSEFTYFKYKLVVYFIKFAILKFK
jgi:hypothetical protein